jgi:circadian clock protein KaiC
VCGSAGCGKTLFAMEFLIRGATEFGEPGAYITFEETEQELAQNVRSLGFDVDKLVARRSSLSTMSR